MEQKRINEARKELLGIEVGIKQVLMEIDKINPDEPIGESRSKMITNLNFAEDVARYGKMVLNDDPHALYMDLAESFRE